MLSSLISTSGANIDPPPVCDDYPVHAGQPEYRDASFGELVTGIADGIIILQEGDDAGPTIAQQSAIGCDINVALQCNATFMSLIVPPVQRR